MFSLLVFVVAAVLQSLSHVWLLVTPQTAARQVPLSSTVSWRLPRITSIELVMLSNHLILFCPLLLLPSIFSRIEIFSSESAVHIRWPKYWSFCSIRPSNDYVTRVCVPRFFVSSQQRFGVTDIKVLGTSQLSGLGQTMLMLLGKSVLQLYFI